VSTRPETRWPAGAAVVVVLLLQATLTAHLVPGPTLLMPGLEALLLVGLLIADPNRLTVESRDLRLPSLALTGLVVAVNAVALGVLIDRLVVGSGGSGRQLLTSAAGVWLTNVVVFALVWWEVDRGGPLGRSGRSTRRRLRGNTTRPTRTCFSPRTPGSGPSRHWNGGRGSSTTCSCLR